MKNLTALFALLSLFISCHKKMTEKPVPIQLPVSPSETNIEVFDQTKIRLVASLRRTACFGKCPAFEVKFFSNGVADFIGKANVPRIGHFQATMKKEWLADFLKEAESRGYFGFENLYPANGQKITDLPITFTSISFDGQTKSIENRFDSPVSLREFEQYFEQKMEQLDWKPVFDK